MNKANAQAFKLPPLAYSVGPNGASEAVTGPACAIIAIGLWISVITSKV